MMQKIIISTLAISCLGGSKIAVANERPNIIVILVDDMGYSDLGCMGSEIQTPNLDRLAKKGVIFTNCYNSSVSCASRASLLTGMYHHATGMGNMDKDRGTPTYQGYLNDKCVTIAEALSGSGYRTIMCGKWHLGRAEAHWPMQRGFERFYGIPSGGGLYFYPSKFLDRPIFRNNEIVIPDANTFYSTDNFTTEAINFIKETKSETEDKPYFLYLAYIAPHFPLQAWPEDIAKYEGKYDNGYESVRDKRFKKQKRLGIVSKSLKLSPFDNSYASGGYVQDSIRKMEVYAAQIDRLDQNIGKLVLYLEDTDQLDNTIIFFMSDNGGGITHVNRSQGAEIGTVDSFTSYGMWGNVSNTPYRKYKLWENEGGIITPLIVHWPNGLKKKGELIRKPVHIIDILPTCLELAETKHPTLYNNRNISPCDGVSLYKCLKGGDSDINRDLFWEHKENKAIRSGEWKLVYEKKGKKGDWELYNIVDDPTELYDLSSQYITKVEELKLKWIKWAKEDGVEF